MWGDKGKVESAFVPPSPPIPQDGSSFVGKGSLEGSSGSSRSGAGARGGIWPCWRPDTAGQARHGTAARLGRLGAGSGGPGAAGPAVQPPGPAMRPPGPAVQPPGPAGPQLQASTRAICPEAAPDAREEQRRKKMKQSGESLPPVL